MSSPQPIEGRCGAKTRDGGYCDKYPLKGRRRCDRHGGKTPRGLAHPNTKTGRYSKYIPKNLTDKYNAALLDPELKELTADLALIETRIAELLENLQGGLRGVKAIKQAMDRVFEADRLQKPANEKRQLLNELARIINSVFGYWTSWEDINRLIDSRRRIIETEAKRQKELNLIVTIPQLDVLMVALVDIIFARVQDAKIRRQISGDIDRLLHGSELQN